jgi:hypothetical protein
LGVPETKSSVDEEEEEAVVRGERVDCRYEAPQDFFYTSD